MGAAEVFISLRSRSILSLFASSGRFLGLEVYPFWLSSDDELDLYLYSARKVGFILFSPSGIICRSMIIILQQ